MNFSLCSQFVRRGNLTLYYWIAALICSCSGDGPLLSNPAGTGKHQHELLIILRPENPQFFFQTEKRQIFRSENFLRTAFMDWFRSCLGKVEGLITIKGRLLSIKNLLWVLNIPIKISSLEFESVKVPENQWEFTEFPPI